MDGKAQTLREEPEDEPIFAGSAPIPREEMAAVGVPEPERAAETERVRRAKGMGSGGGVPALPVGA